MKYYATVRVISVYDEWLVRIKLPFNSNLIIDDTVRRHVKTTLSKTAIQFFQIVDIIKK